MRQVAATEAKARLAELLRNVEQGETIAITRHGKTIAHLVPAFVTDRAAREAAVDRFLQRRERWKGKIKGMTVEEILAARHEGHRI